MKNTQPQGRQPRRTLAMLAMTTILTSPHAQENNHKAGDLKLEPKTLRAANGREIPAEVGRFWVPENRANPKNNLIELAFVRLKTANPAPLAPLVYLAGGPGDSGTRLADSPQALSEWLPYLELCDVILLDQRGTGRSRPDMTYLSPGEPPLNLFVSRENALNFIVDLSRKAAAHLRGKGIDLTGYTTAQSADDLNDLRVALGAKKLNLLGFSYGTHLAQATIKRHGPHLENVIICGVEGLPMTHKFPRLMDTQFRKLSLLAARDAGVNKQVPDLVALLERVCQKLDQKPLEVEVLDPRSRKAYKIPVGGFGLKFIIRMDIGDASDIPVFPKLLHSIDQGDPRLLQWFVQKRYGMFLAVSGMTFVMDGASGASPERWAQIRAEAKTSLFGDVMVLPFPHVEEAWGAPDLGEDFRAPLVSDVRTLFLSGSLDWNTPPHQAEEVRWGFTRGTHLVVENAGHEQVLPQPAIQEAILKFLKGEEVRDVHVVLPPLKFVPIEGYDPRNTHPCVPKP